MGTAQEIVMETNRDFSARLVIYGLGKETKKKDVIKWLEKEIKFIEDNGNISSTMYTVKLMK